MRTKVFISYSHADREWMDRLKLHLTVLERRGLLDVWSDMRIEVGTGWEAEIESALTEARVAVLLISPGYLASDYVWAHEMPRIMAHQKAGMRIIPIIARPCAWRLAEELAPLQARPTDGRPLSTGSEPQVDLDLAALVYEIAAIVGALPPSMAMEEWERMSARPQFTGTKTETVSATQLPPSAQGVVALAAVWHGVYSTTDSQMTLRLERQVGTNFAGTIEYNHGAVTEVVGQLRPDAQVLRNDPGWRDVGPSSDVAVSFRELRTVREGRRPVSLDGEYRAFIEGDRMVGGWFSGGKLLGTFVFTAEGYGRLEGGGSVQLGKRPRPGS